MSFMDYLTKEIAHETGDKPQDVREDLDALSFEEIRDYMHSIGMDTDIINRFVMIENAFLEYQYSGDCQTVFNLDMSEYDSLADAVSDYWQTIADEV